MLSPNIINEAYDELNEQGELKLERVGYAEPKRDPKIERIRKLVSDISSILYKIEDSQYDAEYGKEDDDIRDEMKKSLTKTMVKMVDRLKSVVEEGHSSSDKSEDKPKESENKESKDKESDGKEESDNKEPEEKPKEENKDKESKDKEEKSDDAKDELKKKSKDEIVNQIMKLFPTESVTTPQGDVYSILEINEDKSILENSSGEKFKVENDVLMKWKNN